MACTTSFSYASLTWCPGASRMPGVRKRVYYIRKESITTWPTRANGAFSGNFTLDGTNYWKYIDVVEKSSNHTGTSQGEYPCKTVRQHLEFLYPGLESDIAYFCEQANNDDLVYIVQDANGTFKVLGCENYQTETTFASATGSAATDSMGVTITAECDAPYDLQTYSGTILTAEGEDANPDAA